MSRSPDTSRPPETLSPDELAARKTQVRAWFETLRDRIHAALEQIEEEAPGDAPPAGSSARCGRGRTIPARTAAAASWG